MLTSGVAALALIAAIVGSYYNTRLTQSLNETQQAKTLAEEAQERAEKFQYFYHIAVAQSEWRDGNVGRVEMLLDELPSPQRWEWRYLKRLCHADLVTLGGLLESRKVTPVFDSRHRLHETSEAVRRLAEGHARGKIVVTV